MTNTESTDLALKLLRQLRESVERLSALGDADLDFDTSHGCAMGGSLRRLLIHNAEHDHMHAGQVTSARFGAKAMLESELGRLTRELIRERAELVGQLLQMDDALLEAKAPNDEWSVREHVEHVLYWEKDSMDTVVGELREAAKD